MKTHPPAPIGWIDLLRTVACLLVVFAHCCDPFVAQFDADRTSFLTGVFAGSLVRACVPLFVMMTGVLLLPIPGQTRLGAFYRKRLGRLIRPLLFWSVALPRVAVLYVGLAAPATQNPLIDPALYTAATFARRALTFLFNFNFDSTPLWYLYMLAGLYLVMPILNAWLVRASRREIETLLRIWGLSLLLPYVQMAAPMLGYEGNFGHQGLLGVCDWNPYGTLYYLSGFVGYLVLAYYLTKYPPAWSARRAAAAGIPMFVAGYLVTSLGYVFMQSRFPGNYAYLEIVWYFSGINVFMMTLPLFVWFSRMRIESRQWLRRLAAASFGIYLCHYPFVYMAYDLFDRASWPYLVRIAAMTAATFAGCYLLVRAMQRWRVTERFVR